MGRKIVLIDGHSILNRAFYGVPELKNSEGLHTNAVYGFLNIMFKILDEERPDYLAVAFDVHQPTFRHLMYSAYKGTRKEMPQELREQVPLVQEVLKAMGIKTVTCPGYEADDILGTIARTCEGQGIAVSLVSGDRDLLQLASSLVCVRIPKTRKGATVVEDYHTQEVKDAYQVTPEEFIDVKALMGDTSDNVPGVPGIGEKTATDLIAVYHSIDNIYANLDTVKPARAQNSLRENRELAELSRTLVTIKTDCELDFSLEAAKIGNLYNQEAYQCMKRLEFKSLLPRFQREDMGEENPGEAPCREVTELWEAEEVFAALGGIASRREPLGFALMVEGENCLGLGVGGRELFYFPCGGFLTAEYLCGQLKKLMEAGGEMDTFHFKEQLAFLKQPPDGALVNDLSIAAYLLNPLKDSYDVDDIARDYLGELKRSRADWFGKLPLPKAYGQQKDAYLAYVGSLCRTARRAAPVMLGQLEETDMLALYRDMEMPLVQVLANMQAEGIGVEKEALAEYGQQLKERIHILEQEIYGECGETFNINSPKQLGVILFEKLNLPNGKRTKTGYSTSAEVLEKLRPLHPAIGKILEYRQLAKLKSTYADGLAAFIREDGRIYGKFHQTITATGRISSTEPNLQNIPIRMELGQEIRRVFVPKEGFVFVDADYSQIELRVLAHMSGDERLIAAYNQAQDIHAITASEVFHVPLGEVTPLQRRNAKAVNFGIVYGISAFGLSEDLGISRKEATDFIEQYYQAYPGIKIYLKNLVTSAKMKGYTLTMFGRRRPVPELSSSKFTQRQFGERVAMNAPIQGTAADIIKIAMIRVDRRLRREGFRSRLVLQIHDELLVETAKEEVEQVSALMREEMEGAAKLAVTLEIGLNTGENWLEAK